MLRSIRLVSNFICTIWSDKNFISIGFEAEVSSLKSSIGSINPMPKARFQSRFAITVVKRGFSGLVSHSA